MKDRLKARREKFMDAALDVFLADGFERASIDRVVELSGGSKTTLYKLFGNKEGLFFAILRRAAEQIGAGDERPALPADASGVVALLTEIGMSIVTNILTSRIIGIYQLAVEATRSAPELGKLYFEGGPWKAQGDFADLLRRLDAAGLVRVDDAELASRFFFGMMLDKHHLAMSLGVAREIDAAEAERLVTGAVRVFLSAYGISSPERGDSGQG